MSYALIHELIQEQAGLGPPCLTLSRMCEVLDVARDGYYRWLSTAQAFIACRASTTGHEEKAFIGIPPELDAELDADMAVRDAIQHIALEMQSYGYRPVTRELRRRGYVVNHKRVLRLMREDNLLCLRQKRFHATTDSNHNHLIYPNLVPTLQLNGLDQLWVADITYIQLQQEFIYLAVILDAFSRRCIGWALEPYLDARLSLAALTMAVASRNVGADLVHHSDRGVQYACGDYTSLLQAHGITISMSRKGNPYDNAQAESFMKTLKYEEVYLNEYQCMSQARTDIGHFLESVYNQKRLHSSLGYLPPIEFEAAHNDMSP